ncbi:MAG: DNA polymerase I [Acidobacteria bacterium]|nr:DNA polymerase I [Acidobacteriota bacterium]
MKKKRKKLYLIDGSNNFYRSYYAIRGLTTSDGLATNALYGFIQMLRKLLREHKPDAIAVSFDRPARTFRHEIYPEYKADRKPMPDDLSIQLPLVLELLEGYRIRVVSQDGVEADDLLGSLACRARDSGYEVVIATSDKDFFQLVGDGISVYHTGREKMLDADAVEESFGLPPEKVVDVMAIQGDSIDGVPGIPGIGEKGAKDLIREHGSLEAIYANLDAVGKKSHRKKLEEHREIALLSKDLVTLRCDLEPSIDLDSLALTEPDNRKLHELFRRCEFQSLMQETMPDRTLDWTPVIIESPEELGERTAGEKELAIHVSGSPTGEPRIVAFSSDRDQALVVNAGAEGMGKALSSLFESGKRFIAHNIKSAFHLMAKAGWSLPADFEDTMLISYVLRPGQYGHELESIVREKLVRDLIEIPADSPQLELGGDGSESGVRAAADRAESTLELFRSLNGDLENDPSLRSVYETIEKPLVPVLQRMETAGIRVDVDFLSEMSKRFSKRLDELEERIYGEAGEEFNINSPSQLGSILFEKLGYPIIRKTRKTKGYSTAVEVLEELAARGYPIPALILEHRELHKLKSTYIEAFPGMIGPDGRLRTTFNQAVAATGRLSSSEPNLQNIPIRTELGREIRKAFVAEEGHVIMSADYSQIELRLAAHMSGDEDMIDAFRGDIDIHRRTAARMFGIDERLVNSDQRRAAKTINFGVLYGMSAFRVGNELGIPTSEAKAFVQAYFDRYPKIRTMLDATLEEARSTGKVTTMFGRVRYIPEIRNRSFTVRSNAERMATNAPIQGSAADILKIAMIRLDEHLQKSSSRTRMLLTVHDEIVFEVPEEELGAIEKDITRVMESVATLSVPLSVEARWGRSWFEAKQ